MIAIRRGDPGDRGGPRRTGEQRAHQRAAHPGRGHRRRVEPALPAGARRLSVAARCGSTRSGRRWDGSTARTATGTWCASVRRWRRTRSKVTEERIAPGSAGTVIGPSEARDLAWRYRNRSRRSLASLGMTAASAAFRDARWHLWLDLAPRPGALNMAIDQALLERAARGGERWLRLYRWSPLLPLVRPARAGRRPLRPRRIAELGPRRRAPAHRRPGRVARRRAHLRGRAARPAARHGVRAAYLEVHRMLLDAVRRLGADAGAGAVRARRRARRGRVLRPAGRRRDPRRAGGRWSAARSSGRPAGCCSTAPSCWTTTRRWCAGSRSASPPADGSAPLERLARAAARCRRRWPRPSPPRPPRGWEGPGRTWRPGRVLRRRRTRTSPASLPRNGPGGRSPSALAPCYILNTPSSPRAIGASVTRWTRRLSTHAASTLLSLCCRQPRRRSGHAATSIVIVTGQDATMPIPTLMEGAQNDSGQLRDRRPAVPPPGRARAHRPHRGDRASSPSSPESWTRRDSVTLAFELDPRARWHDGVPVTSRDVLFTFARGPAIRPSRPRRRSSASDRGRRGRG